MFPQVNGCDVTNVPQHVFFNMLRATDRLAKIQVMKIPVKKVGCISHILLNTRHSSFDWFTGLAASFLIDG